MSISCWSGYLEVEIFDGGVVLFLEEYLFLGVVIWGFDGDARVVFLLRYF